MLEMISTETIKGDASLDTITVYWHDYKPGQGMVTLVCWGCAWTAFFGAMSGETIREFFSRADVGYLVTKLGITQFLKQTKTHEKYLGRIVSAVKKFIHDQEALACAGRDPVGTFPEK
jgi:hypothetical protein